MSTNLETKDPQLAKYGGWEEQTPPEADSSAPASTGEPQPLLDEADHVTPETIQQGMDWRQRPIVALAVAFSSVMVLLYFLFSMFGLWGSSEPEPTTTLTSSDAAAIDQEVEKRLGQLQSENEALKEKELMGDGQSPTSPQSSPQSQPIKPVSTATRPVTTPVRGSTPPTYVTPRRSYTPQTSRSTYVTRPVSTQASTPRRMTQPISSVTTKPKATASAKPTAAALKSPPLDPMEQWITAANRGHYITASVTSPASPDVQPAVYSNSSQPTLDAANQADSTRSSAASTADIPTYEPLTPQQQTASNLPQTQATPSDPTQTPGIQPPPANPSQLLDIGSTAKAVIESSIAWTTDGPEQKSSYLLRLKEGFKNRSGVEVLPKDTDLIAQMTETSDAGLFFMTVTHVLRGPNREKVALPQEGIQVVAEDGSPLKADLKQKGGPSFLANAARMLAPGLERAMGAVASSAESLVLEDGDRSLIRTSGNGDNPLAAGVGGVAEGVSQVVTERQNNQRQTSTPYFKFDGGTTVRVVVNQDVQL